jgi:release factor glutamine methyltransferase
VAGGRRDGERCERGRARHRALGLEERVRFVHGDWFDAIGGDEKFEAIVSNPPYVATGEWDLLPEDVRGSEPQQALFSGATGLEALREIVDDAPLHLVAGGLLADN